MQCRTERDGYRTGPRDYLTFGPMDLRKMVDDDDDENRLYCITNNRLSPSPSQQTLPSLRGAFSCSLWGLKQGVKRQGGREKKNERQSNKRGQVVIARVVAHNA